MVSRSPSSSRICPGCAVRIVRWLRLASLAIIGLANIVGSLTVGALGNTYRMSNPLFWVYFTRAVAYCSTSPHRRHRSDAFYAFALVLGFIWLSRLWRQRRD